MMYFKNKLLLAVAILFFYSPVSLVLAVDCGYVPIIDFLTYQNRGDRCEGIIPKSVDGHYIELISVIVDYWEPHEKSVPDYFKLKFYLPTYKKPYLKVRELEYERFYRLDNVNPEQPWREGINDYQWSTKTVIQRLTGLEMYNLGVLVRLVRNEASRMEQVAPVIFYHSQLPTRISGYLFTFKTLGDSKLEYDILKKDTQISMLNAQENKSLGIKRGNKPFHIRWRNTTAEEGDYKLILTGSVVGEDTTIRQTVSFYHKPIMQ